MSNLVSTILKGLGAQTVLPIVEELAIDQLSHQGRATIVKAATLPEHVVDQIVAKTHGDKVKVMAARDKFANDFADLVLSTLPA